MYDKIYLMTYAVETGGPETMHQIVSKINDLGGNGYIYYLDNADSVPIKFSHYNIKIAKKIEDSSKNLILVPELCTEQLSKYQSVNKAILWLSRDNYYMRMYHANIKDRLKIHQLPTFLAPFFFPVFLFIDVTQGKFMFGHNKNKIIHTYNCNYAFNLLIEKGVKKEQTRYLCGPITDKLLFDVKNPGKQDVIAYAYNKSKGIKFIESFIEYARKQNNRYTYIPICNMSEEEVAETLAKAKVYIDFGSFPGPERLPREAVINGCNLITSKIGAAANDVDVPIDRKYKFDLVEENIEKIYDLMCDMCENYDEHSSEFDSYREKVVNQKELFNKTIEKWLIN